MCGIVGYIGKQQVVPVLLAGLKKLEYRGYDSAGIAVINQDGQLILNHSTGKLQMLADKIADDPTQGYVGIGHTRWATLWPALGPELPSPYGLHREICRGP